MAAQNGVIHVAFSHCCCPLTSLLFAARPSRPHYIPTQPSPPQHAHTVLCVLTGEPVADMVSAFEERRNYVVERLRQIPGIKLAEPQVCCMRS